MNTTLIHWCGSERTDRVYLETFNQLIKSHNRLKYTAGIMQSRYTSPEWDLSVTVAHIAINFCLRWDGFASCLEYAMSNWWLMRLCLSLPYVVQVPPCLVRSGGRGNARQADRQANLPDVQGRPKGCSLALYTIHFPLALQDSRRGGGGTHTDQILFSPPIVCVQWPITELHTITNPAYPSPHKTPP